MTWLSMVSEQRAQTETFSVLGQILGLLRRSGSTAMAPPTPKTGVEVRVSPRILDGFRTANVGAVYV